jgi:hypothetical protein
MNVQALQSLAGRRIPVYWFLSDLYLMPPCIERLPQLRAAVEEGCGEHAMALEHALALLEQDAALDDRTLGEEFSRLFVKSSDESEIGGPCESIQRRRVAQRHHAGTVSTAYEEAGFGMPISSVTPADHLGVAKCRDGARTMARWRRSGCSASDASSTNTCCNGSPIIARSSRALRASLSIAAWQSSRPACCCASGSTWLFFSHARRWRRTNLGHACSRNTDPPTAPGGSCRSPCCSRPECEYGHRDGSLPLPWVRARRGRCVIAA